MAKTIEIYNFLKDVDSDFSPSLSSKVNLNQYVSKIQEKAELVIEEDSSIKGMLVLYCNNLEDRYAYISLLGVRKENRGNGIARRMLVKAIHIARDKGMKTLGVHSNNNIAIKLYKSLGFITIEPGDREYLELELR